MSSYACQFLFPIHGLNGKSINQNLQKVYLTGIYQNRGKPKGKKIPHVLKLPI